ncbi:MAG: glutamine--fructose-6-phosphate aminotransferase, partial [Rhodohalobacter sp.]
MCGIVGYVGDRDAAEVLIKGLKRLEYRGYDSAGIAIMNGELNIQKGKGKVANLDKKVLENSVKGHIGIGHTRWATHGEPNDVNSHPHLSESGKVAVVHNGIIENYGSLKRSLTEKGRTFKSMTDTEIIAQLIEEIYTTSKNVTFEEAIRLTLKQIVGTYGLAIVNLDSPEKIYIARKGSPLLLGVGDNEMFIASDASPIVEYTNKVVYLDDGEMAVVERDGYEVKTIDDV